MPKTKTDLSEKLNIYLKEFGKILSIDGNLLLCNVCDKEIKNPFIRSNITQHFSTQKHTENLQTFELRLSEKSKLNNNNNYGKSYCELNLENIRLKSDLYSEKLLLRMLESIKDKVKQILNECKCVDNYLLRNETKELIEKYERMRDEIDVKNCDNFIDSVLNNENKNSNNLSKSVKINTKSDNELNEKQSNESVLKKEKHLNSVKDKVIKTEVNESLVKKKRIRIRNSVKNNRQKKYLCLWPGCELCFANNTKLKLHLRVHLPEKKFVCDEPHCGKRYKNFDFFKTHKETHKTGLKKRFMCEWKGCTKKFSFKYQMNQHMRVNHFNEMKWKCDWNGCGHQFMNKSQYDSHVSQSHVGHNIHKCDECQKSYPTRNNLLTHKNLIHLKTKNYCCDYKNCGERFLRKENLLIHRNSVHNCQIGLLSCDWPGCDFLTPNSGSLKRHKYRHTGEKPYKCLWPQCEWSFRQNWHLRVHMLKHTGERPVKCCSDGCQLTFQSKHAMKVHFDKNHS